TKDFGLNWTKIRIPVRGGSTPTNDESVTTDYDVVGSTQFAQGNYDVSLAVDPNNPNITYMGGTLDGNPYGFIRVDTTTIQDPYALVAYDNSDNDGGLVQFSTIGGVTLNTTGTAYGILNPGTSTNPRSPYFNLLRDPDNPFLTPSTLRFSNVASWTNTGTD